MTNKNFNNKKINNNGFNFVDLGLPSGTLWATMNVGASKPSDSGLYFQWGDVQGYKAEQVGKGEGKKAFIWADYKWNASKGFTKYNTAGESLKLADDAANANMGGSWHMPTPTQIQELINETTSDWAKIDNVNGRLFTSKKDSSKSIFIPATGDVWEGSVYGIGSYGGVWSSMLSEYYVSYGQYLYFYLNYISLGGYGRFRGRSVRGVLDKSLGHKHFEPFQKVLIKEWLNSKSLWAPALYSHYNAENNRHYIIGGKWAKNEHIIPYEGNEYKVGKSAKNN